MKKWVQGVITMVLAYFVFPLAAYASNTGSGDSVNPFKKMKEQLKMRWDILTGLDFVLILIGIALSAIVIYILYKLIVDIFIWIAKVRSGKDSFKNTKFLVEIGITVVILFLFLSGTMFDWLGGAYDWMGNQGLDGTVASGKN